MTILNQLCMTISTKHGLITLGVAIVVIAGYIGYLRWQDDRASSIPEHMQNENVARRQERWQQLNKYRELLKAIDSESVLFVAIERGDSADEVAITVSDFWMRQPKSKRLEATKNLWRIWAGLSNPDEADKARITMRDRSGQWVGGSGVFGSFIDVIE